MTDNRYYITDLHIYDKQGELIKSIYIREVLDSLSDEYKRSKLSPQQKIDIIDSLGLKVLIDVLRKCFEDKGVSYNALEEAYDAYEDICLKVGRENSERMIYQLKLMQNFSELFKNKPLGAVESLTIAELISWCDTNLESNVFKDKEHKSKLCLPPIQRSIVWDNEQIINYWDSLLRGYSAGMMMVHRVNLTNLKDDTVAPAMTDGHSINVCENDFQLFDGQQRLTTILLGLGEGQMSEGRKLWIDLSTTIAEADLNSNLCFQLRISSRGQPFGYRAKYPNQKIELGKRHDKWDEWRNEWNNDDDLMQPQTVFDNVTGLDLIDSTCAIQFSEISQLIFQYSPEFAIAYFSNIEGIDGDKLRDFVMKLGNVLKMQVVLQEVSPEIIQNPEEYIRYFGRLGQGGTRLSDDELTYSIIKLRYPSVRDQMKLIRDDVGRIANEVDLVLSAIRISKTLQPWENSREGEIIGRPNPKSVNNLHVHREVEAKFFELIHQAPASGLLKKALQKIRSALSFNAEGNGNGLPAMLLARFPRELVDVLILFAIKYGVDQEWKNNDQKTLCSFSLYWLLFVKNHEKAGWLVFRQYVRERWSFQLDVIKNLVRVFEEEGAAYFIPRHEDLEQLETEVNFETMNENGILRPWSDRFKSVDANRDQKPGEALRVLSTNRELIQRALMWLQRSYLEENYSCYDPTSDRDDDLPIDLDHIIPHDSFGFDWRNRDDRLDQSVINNEAILNNFRLHRDLVGNSLGNYRWLDARLNRARGNGCFEPLENNANFVFEHNNWNAIIRNAIIRTDPKWTKEDFFAFQRLIDNRTLHIYKIILESGICQILPPD